MHHRAPNMRPFRLPLSDSGFTILEKPDSNSLKLTAHAQTHTSVVSSLTLTQPSQCPKWLKLYETLDFFYFLCYTCPQPISLAIIVCPLEHKLCTKES
jgi:hypothetical protein